MGDEQPGTAVEKAAPRTQEDWLAEQTGVNMFRTADGQLALSFTPEFAQRFNFLAPISQVLQLDASWRPVPKMLQLDPAVDFYSRKGDLQLSKQGLSKLAQLAQIEKDPDRPPKTDYMGGNGLAITVHARQRTIDGTFRRTSGTKTVWFKRQEEKIRRDNASKNENEIEKLLDEYYDQIAQKVETMAWLRCVRELLGVPNKFTRQQAQRPFFVMGVAFVPDWTNPQIGKLLDFQFGQGVKELYGEPPEGVQVIEPAKQREIAPPTGEFNADVTPDDLDDDDSTATPPEADDPEEEWGDEPAAESTPIPRPSDEGFTPKGGPFAGRHVAEWAETDEGKKWLAAAVYRMRNEDKRAQGLAWLSWAEQREVTMEDLEQRAQAQAA